MELFAESDLVTLREAELRFLVSEDFLLSLLVLVPCEFGGEHAGLEYAGLEYAPCVQVTRLLEFVACVNPAYSSNVVGAIEERELVVV